MPLPPLSVYNKRRRAGSSLTSLLRLRCAPVDINATRDGRGLGSGASVGMVQGHPAIIGGGRDDHIDAAGGGGVAGVAEVDVTVVVAHGPIGHGSGGVSFQDTWAGRMLGVGRFITLIGPLSSG